MFVNISPESVNFEATQTALVYGSRAKTITNNTQKNVETYSQSKMNEAYKKMQKWLGLALDRLRGNGIGIPEEISLEQNELKENETELNQHSIKGGVVNKRTIPTMIPTITHV